MGSGKSPCIEDGPERDGECAGRYLVYLQGMSDKVVQFPVADMVLGVEFPDQGIGITEGGIDPAQFLDSGLGCGMSACFFSLGLKFDDGIHGKDLHGGHVVPVLLPE